MANPPVRPKDDRPQRPRLLRAVAGRQVPFLVPHRWILVSDTAGAADRRPVAMLAVPLALRQLVDHGLAANNIGVINRYFVGFLAAAVVFGLFAALRFYLVTWLGERVVADVREAVYARVVRMDPTFFEMTRTGEVLSRLTADTSPWCRRSRGSICQPPCVRCSTWPAVW